MLRCWGNNSYGQVDGSATQAIPTPVAIALDGVTDVTAGDLHTCAIAGGKVFCWGCQASGAFTRDKPKPPPGKAVQTDTKAPEVPGPSDSPEA